MKRLGLAMFLLAMMAEAGLSQTYPVPEVSPGWFNRYGRWSFGIQGGGNIWINDFDTRNITGGGDVYIRYSLTRYFTLGVMGGYDVIESKNQNIQPTSDALKHSFVQAHGINGDLVGWFHLNKGQSISPYIYVGVGSFMYKRTNESGAGWPEDKTYSTLHVPVGVGLDMAFTKYVTLNVDFGGRIMDKATDNFRTGAENFFGTDWYPTARIGLNFYFGSSADDDNDGDGLTNGYEKTVGTDPNKADTDGDGLTDYEEIVKYHTDPLKPDTDGDGLTDGEEVMKYHTDPLKADTDGDGLNDGQEVNTYHTDPLKADTDGDGLNDGDEVLKYHTDPLKTDTDGDGLSDYDEVMKYHTDPLKVDTDGGSVSDGVEVARGTNPLDPSDDIPKPPAPKMEVGKAIVLEGIVFASGKAVIEPQSETTLDGALATLKENPDIAVEIRGYTDNVGKAAANKKLSQRRADAVKSWLVGKGIDSTRITTKGLGPDNPIADNKTPEGRAKNRRIEFYRTK
jgi:outer membrane protein OmpA-like peptidoglycan-associated protein